VQRFFTRKLQHGLSNLYYLDRLHALGSETLEHLHRNINMVYVACCCLCWFIQWTWFDPARFNWYR